MLALKIIRPDILYLPFPDLAKAVHSSLQCLVNSQIARNAAFNFLVL